MEESSSLTRAAASGSLDRPGPMARHPCPQQGQDGLFCLLAQTTLAVVGQGRRHHFGQFHLYNIMQGFRHSHSDQPPPALRAASPGRRSCHTREPATTSTLPKVLCGLEGRAGAFPDQLGRDRYLKGPSFPRGPLEWRYRRYAAGLHNLRRFQDQPQFRQTESNGVGRLDTGPSTCRYWLQVRRTSTATRFQLLLSTSIILPTSGTFPGILYRKWRQQSGPCSLRLISRY